VDDCRLGRCIKDIAAEGEFRIPGVGADLAIAAMLDIEQQRVAQEEVPRGNDGWTGRGSRRCVQAFDQFEVVVRWPEPVIGRVKQQGFQLCYFPVSGPKRCKRVGRIGLTQTVLQVNGLA
jgi:hypothetical protein